MSVINLSRQCVCSVKSIHTQEAKRFVVYCCKQWCWCHFRCNKSWSTLCSSSAARMRP